MAHAGSGDLGRPGGRELEVATYPVDEALNAEGGAAIRSMLAWAIAFDGRFVYVRTDDLAIAEEIARNIAP